MPKMKSHRGAAKRFKKTASGKFKKKTGYHGHLLEKKSPKRKRNMRKTGYVAKADTDRVARMLPYS